MKRRFAFLLFGILCVAYIALGQSQAGSSSAHTSSATNACPQPNPGKVAWFDTCTYLPIGNGVRPGHALSTPDPQYSESARQAKITGQVILAVAINATGVVDSVRVVKPLEPGLDENAVAAVSKWQFTPATKDGKPVAIQMEVAVGYRLY
jgi:TonB family protein